MEGSIRKAQDTVWTIKNKCITTWIPTHGIWLWTLGASGDFGSRSSPPQTAKRKQLKGETWIKVSLQPDEIERSPNDVVAHLTRENRELHASLEAKAADLYRHMCDTRSCELTLNAVEKLPTDFNPVEVSFPHDLFFILSFIHSFIILIIIENSGFIQSPVLAFPLISLTVKMNLEPACILSLKIILVIPQNNEMLLFSRRLREAKWSNDLYKLYLAPVSQRLWVQIPYGPEFFFQVLFSTTRFSSVLSCEELLISSLHRGANMWFSYI